MVSAFILRYAERCSDDAAGLHPRGTTETQTRARGEEPDEGFGELLPRAIPASVVLGTETLTKVKGEGRDADVESGLRIIPQSSKPGTETVTEVTGEQSDLCHSCEVIPTICTATQTQTFVRAEADDQDPRQHDLHAIPRCS